MSMNRSVSRYIPAPSHDPVAGLAWICDLMDTVHSLSPGPDIIRDSDGKRGL